MKFLVVTVFVITFVAHLEARRVPTGDNDDNINELFQAYDVMRQDEFDVRNVAEENFDVEEPEINVYYRKVGK